MCLSMTWVKFNGFHRRRVIHPKCLFLQPFMTLWYFCIITTSQQTNSGGVRDETGLPVPEASLIWDFWVYLCHRILPRLLGVSRKSLQYRPNLKVTTDTLISGKFSLLQLTLFTLYKRQKINYKEQIQTVLKVMTDVLTRLKQKFCTRMLSKTVPWKWVQFSRQT